MSTISRQYEPAPAPLPPDEQYWEALLSQADNEAAISENVPDEEWEYLEKLNHPDNSTFYHAGINADWQAAEHSFNHDLTIQLLVIGYNRGGLLVEWNSLRGFVPASQLVSYSLEVGHEESLNRCIGTKLNLRVIELSKSQNRLILSERAAQVQSGTRAKILEKLDVGATVEGIVTNICDFGAFIDLGGIEGLIHISELSWGRVEHPAEVLKSGQKVKAYVMSLDRDAGRIALSLKRLLPDPWATVEQRYQVGQQVYGQVTSVVDFGAFACLEEGLEGLIHISELAEGHFLHPRNVVREGEQVQVRILNIDSYARRIGLSLRAISLKS